jgi:O-antigen/teichoic acid export membrane protein
MELFKHKLVKNSTIYTGTNLLRSAIPFLLLPVLTRYLTPSDYGIVATFQVLLAFAAVFVGLEARGAVAVNFFKINKEELRVYIYNVVIIGLVSFAITFFVVFLFKAPLSHVLEFPENWLPIIIIVGLCQFFFMLALTLWQVEQKALPYGIFQLSLMILNVSLALIFVVMLGWQWQGRLLGIILTFIVFAFLSAFIIYKRKYVQFTLNKAHIKDTLFFCIPLIPHALGAWIITAIDRIFINSMVSVAATGLYTVGYQVGMIIGLIATSFNQAWSPFLFEKLKGGSPTAKIKIVKLTYLYAAGIILLALMLTIIAPYLLKFFVGKEFHSSYTYVIWIALGYAFTGMYYMVGGYIFYMKKTYMLSAITFSVACTNVILNYVLIKANGAIGAAQATTISFFLSFVLTWICSAKVYKMPWAVWRKNI